MVEQRDYRLGRKLRDLYIPPERPGFWAEVHTALTTAETESATTPRSKTVSSATEPENVPVLTQLRTERRQQRPRKAWIVAIAAAFVAVLAIAPLGLFRGDQVLVDDVGTGSAGPGLSAPTSTDAATATPSPIVNNLTEATLANLTYANDSSIGVQLVDGTASSEPIGDGVTTTTVKLWSFVSGDLDGDGDGDAVVELVTDGGGSGTFSDLYVVMNTAEGTRVSLPVALGDRISALDVTIDDAGVRLSFTDRNGNDFNRSYGVVDGELVRLDPPIPLADPYPTTDSACRIVGESELTVNYLDDTTTLVACLLRDYDTFIAAHGGELVDVIDDYALISVSQ